MVVVQPVLFVNVMVAVPADMPDTIPLVAPTAATAALLLVHPPGVAISLKAVVPPTHTVVTPVMGLIRVTVTLVVTEQVPPKE